MNGRKIEDGQVQQLLELADWAPSHGHTEPWRFVVYTGNAKTKFCADHAELYKKNTPEDSFISAKYQKQLHMGDTLSHIVAVYMKRTVNSKIPVIEELTAVAAAMQNMLLGAHALGIAALWSTGGMTHHPAMKQYLGLATGDIVIGLLYLGYTDEPEQQGKRAIPLQEKVNWNY